MTILLSIILFHFAVIFSASILKENSFFGRALVVLLTALIVVAVVIGMYTMEVPQ